MNHTRRALFTLLFMTGLAGAVFWLTTIYSPDEIQTFLQDIGPTAIGLFLILYLIVAVSGLPALWMTILGGGLFGPLYGSVINAVGGIASAIISFLLARSFLHEFVLHKLKRWPRIHKIIGHENKNWFEFALTLRLIPLVPFSITNYAFGLTTIKFREYALSTAIGTLPGLVAYTYLGATGKSILEGGDNIVRNLIIAGILFIVVGFGLPFLLRKRRKALDLDD